jgi:uncharacterized membrane protein (UPF0136 family)
MSAAMIMTLIYGALAMIGGIIGFKQAQSKASLISGLVTGIGLLIAGVGLLQAQMWGFWLAIALTLLLVVVFIGRLVKTRKFMPAGLMVVVGVVTLIALLAVWS